MTIETLSESEFHRLAPMVDANQAKIRTLPNGMPSADYKAALPYPEIGNDEYGAVEQYRLRRDKPDSFGAYLSSDGTRVTVWTGQTLGHVMGTIRKDRGRENFRFSFRMNGRDYHCMGGGRGMYCGCKAYKGK